MKKEYLTKAASFCAYQERTQREVRERLAKWEVKEEDAEEVTQEVFLTVYHKLKEFRFQSSFKTWVYRITVNQAINYSKKAAKQRNRSVEYTEEFNAVSVNPEAGLDMEREAREKLVHKLLSNLNPEQRACIVLRNLEGLSYQEIAEQLGEPLTNVKIKLLRAKKLLAEIIENKQ